MSDPILHTSNVANTNNIDQISQIKDDNDLIDNKTDEIQKKLTSQDNIEKLSTQKSSGSLGKILKRIAGGILLAAGIAAATVATVCSMGIAPAFVAGIAAAIGGVTGASITAGVTGAAGIGCLVSSFMGNHKTESFVNGQNAKANTNDNLDMIRNNSNNANNAIHNNIRDNLKDEPDINQMNNIAEQANNAAEAKANTAIFIRESYENVKDSMMTVLTGKIEVARQRNYLNAFADNELKNSVKAIVDDVFTRASTEEINNIIRNTFTQRTDIEQQLQEMKEDERKNAFMCCVFGNSDDNHNAFSLNIKSTSEDFIASIKSLIEFYVPVKEQIQIEENEENHEGPVMVNNQVHEEQIEENNNVAENPKG